MKKRFLPVILLLALMAGLFPAHAQSLDDQLQWNDYYVSSQFYQYPRDTRYDAYMTSIAQNLNSTIIDTFGNDKNITFYVCPSRIGFNALSFHQFIVFDSMLLDTLRYLAIAKVYYGNVNNNYVNSLAEKVAIISNAYRNGMFNPNFYNSNNPFGFPPVGTLNPAQQKKAEQLFTGMLASWMAHEGSHCMREHMKYRLQVMNQQGDNPQNAQINMNQYMQAQLSRELEKDADVCATIWLINSGYDIEGFVTWLQFGEKLEHAMGTENTYLRTHPKCSERIEYIRQAARSD